MILQKNSFQTLMVRLGKDLDTHARLVNTFSLLEYIGARKMMKSLDSSEISLELLRHVSEEIRHAQNLKKLALKMSRGRLTSYSEDYLLCGQVGREYIQAVDHAAEELLGKVTTWQNYLITTFLLEERANVIYPYYEGILAELGFPNVLRGIVAEEASHLAKIVESLTQEKVTFQAQFGQLRRIENVAFERWIREIFACLDVSVSGLDSASSA